ncbi:hypothetical protein [Thiovibrio frasassiensis]|uniref:Uncharacterized protein n=1 Tax=Thiovibrio frasassiensis TaxID=2984131 RepID=A0A9X4MDQ8_9BACT|nr:hypothetical protein [Thiovibrio frasassiensis]MDG4474687.1 hypothetical protein [Thiovibrio frasassiensis]
MTDNAPERDFHAEIDDAIDNLFAPHAGAGLDTPVAPVSEKSATPAPAVPTSEKVVPVPVSLLSADGTDAFIPFEEALLSLDWEISAGNIETARNALKEIQGCFEVDKAVALTEIFALMDRLLEVMVIAPQRVPTSAPKILQEGLQTLRAAAGAEDLSLVEQTLIDPTLSELRSAIPNIPKDYSQFGQAAAPKTQNLSASEQKTISPPTAAVRATIPPVQSVSGDEDFLPELPAASGTRAAQVLIEAVNAHLVVLGKCIAKRIIPVENLFAKTPGYEKLHAIHTELRERLEKQKQNLLNALGGDYQADAAVPAESAKPAASAATPCPWQTVALATWGGKMVGFLPEQIVYEDTPGGRVRKCGSFLSLKNLKRGFFGKIGLVVRGELGFLEEAILKTLTIPVAKTSASVENEAKADSPLLVLFKANSGMAFWLDGPTEQIDTSNGCCWEPLADPSTLVAGNLMVNGKSVPVITLRSV